MTDRRHMDPNLMGPPCLKLASNETRWGDIFLVPPMGRGVPTALRAHDGHFLPITRISAHRRCDLSCAHFEAAPNERPIFSLERAGAAMVGEEFGQAPMGGVCLRDHKESRRILVEPVHDSGPLDPADPR